MINCKLGLKNHLTDLNFGVAFPITSIWSGSDPGFWEGGSEHRGGSLKQGVWEHSPPEAIGCFLFIALKSCQNARFKAYSYLFVTWL